jgi:hypothetical protein
MRWSDEEKLRIAIPYVRFEWRDDGGKVIETMFNVRYQAIASRIDGKLYTGLDYITGLPVRGIKALRKWPPPAEYYYGPRSPANGDPFGYGRAGAAARECCRGVLKAWGIDPDERMREAAREWRWERRVQRWEDKTYGRG